MRTWIAFTVFAFATLVESTATARNIDTFILATGANQSAIESNVVKLLTDRIAAATERAVQTTENLDADSLQKSDCLILFGIPSRWEALAQFCEEARIPLPTDRDPGGEGFVLNSIPRGDGLVVVAAAVDERGLLYAAGELLRQLDVDDDGATLPDELNVRTAPAFNIRGLIVGQGHTMRELTGAREWTDAEWRRAVLDYALAGANTFTLGFVPPDDPKFQFLKSYGLDVLVSWSANVGAGPPEWRAVEAIGRTNYLCPSIPEARAAILDAWEKRWRNAAPFDYLRIKSGDGGGCECDKCRPFGAVYMPLVEEMARIVHKYSPNTKITVANQKLDNAGDQAIFDFVNAAPRPWMHSFCFGPGSNAMGWAPGRRQDHRMDLFDHPGFGPHSRYLKEILHQLPPGIDILMFTDITHWVYSQYGLMDHEIIPDRNHEVAPHWGRWLYDMKPIPALAKVYDRRTFFARPRHYHRVFQLTAPYTIGDVAYSEGHHDHVNQWLWQRLLWSPHRSAEDIVGEYARTWFGAAAAATMTEAILQAEKNLSPSDDPMANADRLVQLLRSGDERIPSRRIDEDYLWRQFMQKALLDRYVLERESRQLSVQTDVEELLEKALTDGEVDDALERAATRFGEEIETPAMKELRAEAGRLGEESDAIFGVRNVGYFNLNWDLVGLGWLRNQVETAQAASGAARRGIVERVVYYEDAGDGGFYDDAGDPTRSSHLTHGWPYSDGDFAETNRGSQNTMAFTTDEEQGVTFEYHDLDPNANYRVRISLVRPRFLERYQPFQTQTSQSVYADDVCLAENLGLPEHESRFFEFDIPHEVTSDGELKLWFQKASGVGEGAEQDRTVWRNTGGWGTLCSEVWLMKVD